MSRTALGNRSELLDAKAAAAVEVVVVAVAAVEEWRRHLRQERAFVAAAAGQTWAARSARARLPPLQCPRKIPRRSEVGQSGLGAVGAEAAEACSAAA